MTTATDSACQVLLVEDEPAHAELISRAFEDYRDRFVLTVATSLREARAALQPQRPDLVIIDLNLPDGRGTDILIREDEHTPFPVVVMTSHGDEQLAVDTMKAGALDYVVKSEATLCEMPRIAERTLREWRHIAERARAEEALRASERRYRALYDGNPSMCFTVDASGVILSINHFGAQQLGYDKEELVGTAFTALFHESDGDAVQQALAKVRHESRPLQRWEARKVSKAGSTIWVRDSARVVEDESGRPVILVVCEDVTEARKLSEELSYQACHDSLTNLVNRAEFERRLALLLDTARDGLTEHALCYLDLDQFKVINDTCGHVAGDVLLRKLASMLQNAVRSHDTVARLGGDEFGIIMEHCSVEQAGKLAGALLDTFKDFHFAWENKYFNVGMSMGLVAINNATEDATYALRMADSACYAAKDAGRNRIQVYRASDAELVRRHGEMHWVSRITQALEANRLELHFQNIVPVRGDVEGHHFELLVRLREESGSLVSPTLFLPAAERYNLIGKIDRWVVRCAFDWLQAHPDVLASLQLCAINLSGQSVGDDEFRDYLVALLRDTRVPAGCICFEITETAAIANLRNAVRFIDALREQGCHFALDDFGSGLSSFAYLKNMPVDYLKIDGAFVKDMANDAADVAIVRSIHQVAHVTGKKTVAEFVENEATLSHLREIGVDYAQGYGVAIPRPLIELAGIVQLEKRAIAGG